MKAKNLSDRELDALERLVPDQARSATQAAYVRALSVSPRGILRVDAGDLVRMSADGTKTVIAKAKPRHKVKVGDVVTVSPAQG